jgi:hypothetical protein
MKRALGRDQAKQIRSPIGRIQDVDALIQAAIPQVAGAPTAGKAGPRWPRRRLSRQVEGSHVDKALGSVHDRLALATSLLQTAQPELRVDGLNAWVERAMNLLEDRTQVGDKDSCQGRSFVARRDLDETAV